MSNPKQLLAALAAGLIGGFLAVLIVLPFFIRTNFLNTAVILNKVVGQHPATTAKGEEKPAVTRQPNYFSDAIGKIQPSIVSVQSFLGGVLLRSGSGVILTQDGLIATLNSVVPPDAEVFQVADNSKIYKAKVVSRDFNANIALISIPEADLPVVRLKSDMPGLAQNLLVFEKFMNLSEDNPVVQEVLVSQTDVTGSQFKISAPYDPKLYGGAVIDNEGNVLGLLDFRNQKPVIIFSKTIGNALDTYLTKGKRL